MIKAKATSVLFFLSLYSFSQNDLDAMRYSQYGIGGTARSLAMGGAFGAVGADLSCGAYNPAGLGLYHKGDLSFTGSLKISNNQGNIYGTKTNLPKANFAFNNFGIAAAWKAEHDPESRNVIAFSNVQTQNFYSTTKMQGYTNNSSIAKDMLNLANEAAVFSGNGAAGGLDYLYYDYEGLGYNTFLLDTADNKFFSFLDTKRSVKQTRELATEGRVNDLNFSYAYSYKDQMYFGFSVGVPRVNYVSTTTHREFDELDSMRVNFSDSTFTDTYTDPLPVAYSDMLGFSNLTYTEYLSTKGFGLNLKIGGIARLTDDFRLGIYYHTPTIYYLTDTYFSNTLSTTFDYNPDKPVTDEYAMSDNDMGYSYRITTPSRFSVNAAYIINKIAVIALDYESVNYRNAKLKADNNSFDATNKLIKNNYKTGHNLRIGGELNIKPLMLRAGYCMQGSPYGKIFSGDYVRNTFSLGIGVRIKENFYVDATLYRSTSQENYYLFYTLDTKAKLNYQSTSLAVSVGTKF